MARLPQPGGDAGNWGEILNDYLLQAHKSDGLIKDNAVTASALAPNSVTSAALAPNSVTASQLADNSVTAATIADGSITEAQLDSATQVKLNTSTAIADGSIAKSKLDSDVQDSLNRADAMSAASTKVGVSNFVNSWWCLPRSIYSDLRSTIYQGGVSAEGTMQIARLDLRRKMSTKTELGTYEVDDHNVPAFLIEDDKPPIVALVRHAVEPVVRIRIGAKPHDVESLAGVSEIQVTFPGSCTYAHLIRKPGTNTVALLTRSGTDGWYLSVSRDWGQTWEAAKRFHGYGYGTFTQHFGVVHYAVTVHTTTGVNSAIRYMRIDTRTGIITNAGGTEIGNLWAFGDVIPSTSMTLSRQSYDIDTPHNSNRTFDLLADGSILAMQLDKTNPAEGGQYGVYRFSTTGATSPSSSQSADDPQRGWTFESIVHSGVPVGYYQSSYVGGMSAGANENEVYLDREDNGTWRRERWTKTSGVWALAQTIATYANGTKLGRPQVPWGAYGNGLFMGLEYFQYPTDSFTGYYGDQVVYETGVHSPLMPDSTAPGVPTSLSAAAGDGAVALAWQASNDDRGGVVTYKIYNGATLVQSVTATAYTATAPNGTAVTFRIVAADAANNESASTNFPTVTPSAVVDTMLSAGSLMLVEPAHPNDPWAAGVPAHGSAVKNLAGVTYPITVTNTLDAASGQMERTGKGGLHAIISQVGGATGKRYTLDSQELRDYVDSHKDNDYYLSLWFAPTRLNIEGTPTPGRRMFGFLGSSVNDTAMIREASGHKVSAAPSANRTIVKETASPAPLETGQLVYGAWSVIASALGVSKDFIVMGHIANSSSNVAGSWVLYRAYMEDLTVSQRTPATVAALDQQMYDQAFGAGGRYVNDTHTAVSVLP